MTSEVTGKRGLKEGIPHKCPFRPSTLFESSRASIYLKISLQKRLGFI
jgi:hypothetical protein